MAYVVALLIASCVYLVASLIAEALEARAMRRQLAKVLPDRWRLASHRGSRLPY